MKRLHKLTPQEIEEWRIERQMVGALKYKDSHLQRYGLVDVIEELLDAQNILDKTFDRIKKNTADECDKVTLYAFSGFIHGLQNQLTGMIQSIKKFDELVDDKFCTDEQGGERIWWSEENDQ